MIELGSDKKTQTQTKCPQHKINYNLIAGRGRTSLPEHKRHRCYQSFPCRLGSRSPWIACFEIDVEKPESWNDCTSQTLLFWQLQWSSALWLSFPSSSFYSRKVSTNETARGDECPPHHFPLSFYFTYYIWAIWLTIDWKSFLLLKYLNQGERGGLSPGNFSNVGSANRKARILCQDSLWLVKIF